MTNEVFGDFTKDRGNYDPPGRFPANVLHDGSPEVLAAFAQFGESLSVARVRNNCARAASVAKGSESAHQTNGHSDSGTAARFFLALGFTDAEAAMLRFFYSGKANADDRDRHVAKNNHAAVKPQALMRWLVRLVTPPGGHVLDPFAGSGTANEIGMSATLIELCVEHIEIIKRRPVQPGLAL